MGGDVEGGSPAGWYPSPDPEHAGRFARYWDGTAWTPHLVAIGDTPQDATGATPVQPAAPAGPAADPSPTGRPLRRRGRLPKLIIAAAVLTILAFVGIEALPGSGPIGYSLTDRTTAGNRLIAGPTLRVSIGETSQELVMRPRGGELLTRFTALRWDLDEPLVIEIVPAYPGEPGHVATIDLREAGANALVEGWFVRVDVVALDRAFEVTVRQPVVRGVTRSHQAVHEVRLARGDEAVLRAQLLARQAVEREVLAERRACVAEERALVDATLAAILTLDGRFDAAEAEHFRFGSEPVPLTEVLRSYDRVVDDGRRDGAAAAQALADLDGRLAGIPELQQVIDAHATAVDAQAAYRVGLQAALRDVGTDLSVALAAEFAELSRSRLELGAVARRAGAAVAQVRTAVVEERCEQRHPLP